MSRGEFLRAVAVFAAVFAAALAVLTLVGCGAPVRPLSTAPPPVSATVPPAAVQAWCRTGYRGWQAVDADIPLLQSAVGQAEPDAEAGYGSQLASDAQTAGQVLPPFSRPRQADYALAMAYLTLTGARVARGDITGAAAALQMADGYVAQVAGLVARTCPG